MKSFQLCSRDEYNQNSILVSTTDDFNALMKRVTDELIDRNENNALTIDDKNREWELYIPVWLDDDGNISMEILYGGIDTRGDHMVYVLQNNGEYTVQKMESIGRPYKIWLGELDKKTWFAQTERREDVTDINDRALIGKEFLFFRNPDNRL